VYRRQPHTLTTWYRANGNKIHYTNRQEFSYTHFSTEYINILFLSQTIISDLIIKRRQHFQILWNKQWSKYKMRIMFFWDMKLRHWVIIRSSYHDAPSYLQRQNPQPHHCKNLKTEMSGMCCVRFVELVASITLATIPSVVSVLSPTPTNPFLLLSAPLPPHSVCSLWLG